MKEMSIKTVVAVGIGAALFFVLARFVAIPSGIANTSICLQYAVLALFAILYGPVAGGLIGFIGHTLGDLSWGGSPWWSWVLASAMVGVIIGLVSKKIDLSSGRFGKKELITFVLTTAGASNIGYSKFEKSSQGKGGDLRSKYNLTLTVVRKKYNGRGLFGKVCRTALDALFRGAPAPAGFTT